MLIQSAPVAQRLLRNAVHLKILRRPCRSFSHNRPLENPIHHAMIYALQWARLVIETSCEVCVPFYEVPKVKKFMNTEMIEMKQRSMVNRLNFLQRDLFLCTHQIEETVLRWSCCGYSLRLLRCPPQ